MISMFLHCAPVEHVQVSVPRATPNPRPCSLHIKVAAPTNKSRPLTIPLKSGGTLENWQHFKKRGRHHTKPGIYFLCRWNGIYNGWIWRTLAAWSAQTKFDKMYQRRNHIGWIVPSFSTFPMVDNSPELNGLQLAMSRIWRIIRLEMMECNTHSWLYNSKILSDGAMS